MFFFYLKTQFVPQSKHSASRLLGTCHLILYTAKLAVCLDIRTGLQINRFGGRGWDWPGSG